MNTTLPPLAPPERPDDARLSAWIDAELDAAGLAQVEAWVRDHPEDAARVRAWTADRDALRALFDPVLDEPLPPGLLHTVQSGGRDAVADTGAAAQPGARAGPGTGVWRAPWRRAAMVAALLLTGGAVGGLVGVSLGRGNASGLAALPLPWADRDGAQVRAGAWQHRAAVAHAVYAPEVRHPVEVNVAQGSAAEQRAQEEHLTRWLSKRLDMPVPLFDLRPHGFELVGGRLLPDANGPSAQLMYQNGSGQRVTVYLRKPAAGSETAFRFQRDGELGLFYWVEDGFGCALVGKLPRAQLLQLADAVYKQAEDSIAPAMPAAKPPAS
jgi:anti-sigma factor RsiW